MFKNYMKISMRNILRNRSYSLINIAGLAVGMACFILISLWVQDEISYDRFHEKIDNLYRVIDYEKYSNGNEVTEEAVTQLSNTATNNLPKKDLLLQTLHFSSCFHTPFSRVIKKIFYQTHIQLRLVKRWPKNILVMKKPSEKYCVLITGLILKFPEY